MGPTDAFRSMSVDQRVQFNELRDRVRRGLPMVEEPPEMETATTRAAIETHTKERGFTPFAPAR